MRNSAMVHCLSRFRRRLRFYGVTATLCVLRLRDLGRLAAPRPPRRGSRSSLIRWSEGRWVMALSWSARSRWTSRNSPRAFRVSKYRSVSRQTIFNIKRLHLAYWKFEKWFLLIVSLEISTLSVSTSRSLTVNNCYNFSCKLLHFQCHLDRFRDKGDIYIA